MENSEMRNTKISLSWILLATIPSCLAFRVNQIEQNDELYVVKYPTENQLTCFSEDDDAALVWNDDLSTREPSDDFNNFEPVKPIENILLHYECAIWKSRECFIGWSASHSWKIVSAITNPMAPVYDFRWEGFKEYVVDEVGSKNVLSLDAEDGTVIFSIRGKNDVQIHLCRNTDMGLSSCPVIKFVVHRLYFSIEYCEFRRTTCQETSRSNTHETAFLDADEWRTFRLQWVKNEGKIEVFRDRDVVASLQINLRELRFIRNISISSSAVARIRFHDYNYILATYKDSIITTKEFNWSDDSFCVNMLVSLCSECHLMVSLRASTSNIALAQKYIYREEQLYSSGLREWQPVNLTSISKISSQQVQLQFRAGLDNRYRKDVWWAIDDLRLCQQNSKKGVRKSTIKLPSSDQTGVGTNIKCQKLLQGKTAIADSSTSLPQDDTTRLGKYVKDLLTQSYFPGCRASSITNCDDIDSTSDRKIDAGNESEAQQNHPFGESCFRIIPGKTNFTIYKTLNSWSCSEVVERFSLSVIVKKGYLELGRQTCTSIPCQFHAALLQPFTTYNVVVQSSSHVVVFNKNVKTLESAPEAIRDIILEPITATSVKGRWNQPVRVNGIIRNYTVTIQKVGSLGCKDYQKSLPMETGRTKNVTGTTASFTGLHPYATYQFKVIANTVEPGPKYSEYFNTSQLDIPTSKVSNLRIVRESILVWEPPADCTAITGSTYLTKLVFRGVSEWVKDFTFNTVISHYKYALSKLKLVPNATYGACAYVVRNYSAPANLSNCQELQWTTATGAPPAVEEVQIYDADASGGTISVRCKPSYPSFGVFESYQVSIANRLIHVSETKTCEESYVCMENLSLPSNISIHDDLELQIFAKDPNVFAGRAVISKEFQLNDLYNKGYCEQTHTPLTKDSFKYGEIGSGLSRNRTIADSNCEKILRENDGLTVSLTRLNVLFSAPGRPQKLQVTPGNQGIVMLTWQHPSFTPTKIVRFIIRADCLRSNLTTSSCENILPFHHNITNAKEKSHSMELYLQPSSKYRLHVAALNYRNKISTPIIKNVSTSASVSFASENELRVINAIDVVTLEIPAVLNATRHTTIIVKVEGPSLCSPNSSRNQSPLKNEINIGTDWDVVKYSVNSSQPINCTFELNQHYGVQKNCRFQRMETYRFVVTLTDPALEEPLILETAPTAFTDEKSPAKQMKTWPVILIPILIICLLLLILLIWYRKHKKIKTQTIDSQDALFDPQSSNPVNSRVQLSDAYDLPSDPVHKTSSENFERQTSFAQNVPLEPTYVIPRNPTEQTSHLQNVALAPVYTNIPNDSKEESSRAQNIPLDPEYWEILDNPREQPSHPQDLASAPIYMNTLDNSKGESSHSRDALLEPEYLIILDDSREETSHAQDTSLVPVYMNIWDYSKEQTRYAHDTQ